METQLKRRVILSADDDEGDRFLIDKAMKASGVEDQVQFFEDGQKLVNHLTENLKLSRENREDLPSLILLDLNMPLMDGREALKIVKSHSELKEIPVVILSNSCNPDDVASSYHEGANSFFTKPMDYLELVQLMGLLRTYWFQRAQLPK